MISLIKQIEKFNTIQIIEAIEETLQNDGSIRENLLEGIKNWDSDSKEDLLFYLNNNFRGFKNG